MRKEQGNTSKNARIKIDYSKKKPKVSFSYPSKGIQFEGSMLPIILIFWAIIFFIIIIPYRIFDINQEGPEEKENLIEYNLSNYEEYVIYFEENNIMNQTFIEINKEFIFWNELKKDFQPFPWIVFGVIALFAFLSYYPFKKDWANVYPKYMAFTARKKVTRFNHKDIREENKLYYCELPIFDNIILNYKATQDFSRYLELFEIREHNFKYYYKRRKRKKLTEKQKKRRAKRKKSRQLNEYLWYARFYFKQKPKKGYIEILYK